MAHKFTTDYLEDSILLFHYYKRLGEGALAQVSDQQLFQGLGPESNSIAVIVKHMSGNMRSRWTDFLTTDGEKVNRNRDAEFESGGMNTRAEVLNLWEEGWSILFSALEPLSDEMLSHPITIRREPHSVMQAVNRQMAHYSYHVGQIIFLAKHFCSDRWRSLSVPRGKSSDFNTQVRSGKASQR